MVTKHVIVKEYNPQWKKEFELIQGELFAVLSGEIIAIEHVGSTSVVGLAAKPIIDIDIVIDQNFEEVRKKLEVMGYIYKGDLGIIGREAFTYDDKPHLMLHHLYVCNKDNEELHRHITFRDYLKEHREDRDKYGAIKREMALNYPNDIDSYIKGKSAVVMEIYKKCGLST